MKPSNELTFKQNQVLMYLISSTRMNGYQPTVLEMAKALGYKHHNCINAHIRALEKKGKIERTNCPRKIKIL